MRATKVLNLLIIAGLTFSFSTDIASAQQVKDLAVTVYNGNYAVIRELRDENVAADGSVRITGVPITIDPTTVSFKCLNNPQVRLLEHNYQYDMLNTDSLLNKYIDKQIVINTEKAAYHGTLMSYDHGQIILKTDAGIVMINRGSSVENINFAALPEGLLTKPTLMCLLAGAKTGSNDIELSYQAGGVNWHSEYVMILNEADTAADISGWVSATNRSGRSYKDAKFKFIAGDVRRQQLDRSEMHMVYDKQVRAVGASYAAAPMQEKSFFDYHMYTLPRRTTLANNETKQLELFSPAKDVKVKKVYKYRLRDYPAWVGSYAASAGSTGQKVGVFVEFTNNEEAGLGKPLPAGTFRVFKTDTADNSLQFIGENRIDHTPKDEKLSFEIGKAFDLVAQWKQTNIERNGYKSYKVRSSSTAIKIIEESYEVKLRNRKDDEDVTIRVEVPLDRGLDWEVIRQNIKQKYVKKDAHNIYWDLDVAAGEEVILEYTIKYEIE